MVDSQKPRGGVSVVFVPTWSSSSGPSDMLAAPRGHLCPPLVPKTWTGQRPARAGPPRLALSQSQARPLATPDALCLHSFASREPGVHAAPFPACVCACLCVRLPRREQDCACLICTMGGGLRVACLTALCLRRWCSEGKLLRNRGFQDDICDHLCVFCCFNLDKTALEREASRRLWVFLCLDFRCLQLDCRLCHKCWSIYLF